MMDFTNAQTENYTNAIDVFQTNYNNADYEKIFNSFSSDMQKALPIETTKQFFTNLSKGVGKMESKSFVSHTEGLGAIYKSNFERALQAVQLSLDDENKINGLLVKPFQEKSATEKNTINELNDYPEAIADVIFEKCKAFPNNTQLSIAVIQDSEIKYYGIIKSDNRLKAIDNKNKVFEIGSITKVFTSTVLAALVLDDKIKLTNNINDHYPFKFNRNIDLSFENLANHTAGLAVLPSNIDLSNQNNPYKTYGKKQIEEYLKNELEISSDSLKKYSYSNLGVGLLGHTLGMFQNKTFQELLQSEIFDKYQMTNSFTSAEGIEDSLIKGLDEEGNEVSNWDFQSMFAAGGILSTTEDLTKFAMKQFDPANEALALTRKPTFTVSEEMKIGLGWHIINSKNGEALHWHNGGTGGYTSSMTLDLKTKSGVIILSNVSAFGSEMTNIDGLCFELIEQLLEK